MKRRTLALIILCLAVLNSCHSTIIGPRDDDRSSEEVVVIESFHTSDDRGPDSNELPLAEVAEIFQQQFELFMNDSLAGRYLVMEYMYNFHVSNRYWTGVVYNKQPDVTLNRQERDQQAEAQIFIVLDAETGRLINLGRYEIPAIRGYSIEEIWRMSDSERQERFPSPTPREIRLAEAAALAFGEKYYGESDIRSIQLGIYTIPGDSLELMIYSLNFILRDSEGRVVEIEISRDSHELFHIHTPYTREELERIAPLD